MSEMKQLIEFINKRIHETSQKTSPHFAGRYTEAKYILAEIYRLALLPQSDDEPERMREAFEAGRLRSVATVMPGDFYDFYTFQNYDTWKQSREGKT